MPTTSLITTLSTQRTQSEDPNTSDLCVLRVLRVLRVEWASRIQLPFDPRQEIRDVVALEKSIAQRLHDPPPFIVGGVAIHGRVPRRRQRLQLAFVVRALRLDRRARALEPR